MCCSAPYHCVLWLDVVCTIDDNRVLLHTLWLTLLICAVKIIYVGSHSVITSAGPIFCFSYSPRGGQYLSDYSATILAPMPYAASRAHFREQHLFNHRVTPFHWLATERISVLQLSSVMSLLPFHVPITHAKSVPQTQCNNVFLYGSLPGMCVALCVCQGPADSVIRLALKHPAHCL